MTDTDAPVRFVRPLRFPAAHPSFAGHFPGQPIVAGVLLLEAAAAAVHVWRGGAVVRQVVDAKFLLPLLPDQDAEVELEDIGASRFRFTVRRGADTLVRGTLEAGA